LSFFIVNSFLGYFLIEQSGEQIAALAERYVPATRSRGYPPLGCSRFSCSGAV
jgi:hypothetical protein